MQYNLINDSSIQSVLTILQQHYLNVGSDGYDKDTYQDEYLQGISDGVELVAQALTLAKHHPDQYQQRFVQHQFGQSKILSLNVIQMWYMLGTYRPNVKAKAIPVFLIVHVPKLKFSHCYELTNIVKINQYDNQFETIENDSDNLRYHLAVAKSFHEIFDSDSKTTLPNEPTIKIDSPQFLIKQGNEYANEYQFATDNIRRTSTSEATLDLDIQHLIQLYHA